MHSSHRHGHDNTVLSCRWCEQNWRQVNTVFSSSHCISRLDKTVSKLSVVDSLDLSPILFTPLTRAEQDKTASPTNRLSMVPPAKSYPGRRCELGINELDITCIHLYWTTGTRGLMTSNNTSRVSRRYWLSEAGTSAWPRWRRCYEMRLLGLSLYRRASSSCVSDSSTDSIWTSSIRHRAAVRRRINSALHSLSL